MSCGMSVPVFRDNYVNSWRMQETLRPHWAGLHEPRLFSLFVSRVIANRPRSGKRWRMASQGGEATAFGVGWRRFRVLGGSLLSCALRMLSWSKITSNWLTSEMWSAHLLAVASGARPNGRWRCRSPRWLASACFPLPVYQKLVVGLELW
jgi:hypothetical protein